MTDAYDVAVVGAGPGGSAAAITLARAGLRVALIDRQEFPRTKPCGDLIGCGGITLARALGVDAETLAPYRPLRGAVIVAPETRPLVLRAAATAAGTMPASSRAISSIPRSSAPPNGRGDVRRISMCAICSAMVARSSA